MLRHRPNSEMTGLDRSRPRGAATRSPARLLPHALLALAAALALLLSGGGVDTANAQGTPQVLLSNIGQSTHASGSLTSRDYAQSFTTGTHEHAYVLSSIRLRLVTDADPEAPTVKLFSGSANGMEVATLSLQGTLNPSTTADYTFAPSGTLVLAPNTTYWVVAEGGDTNFRTTNEDDYDSVPAPGWSLGNRAEGRDASSTGAFTSFATNRIVIEVNGYARQPRVLVSNIDQPRTPYSTLLTQREKAYSFTTGPNVSGYDLTSLVLRLGAHMSTAPPSVKLVVGSPTGPEVATFSGPRSLSYPIRNHTFTPDGPAKLCSSHTYYVVASGGGALWQYTYSGAVDASSSEGWSMGDVILQRDIGSSSDFHENIPGKLHMMRVNGTTTAESVVTPVSEPTGGDLPASTSTTGVAPFNPVTTAFVGGDRLPSDLVIVTGNISSTGDKDWFRLHLGERCGRVFLIEVRGADTGEGTLTDAAIGGIYDTNGDLVVHSGVAGQFDTIVSDGFTPDSAGINFTPPAKGIYYLEVTGNEGATGTYTVSVREITDTTVSQGDYDALTVNFDVGETVPAGYVSVGQPATGLLGEFNVPLEGDTFNRIGAEAIYRLNVQPGRRYRVTLTTVEKGDITPGKSASQSNLGMSMIPMVLLPREPIPQDLAFNLFGLGPNVDLTVATQEFLAAPTRTVTGDGELPLVWHVLVTWVDQTGWARYSLALTDITDIEKESEVGWETTAGTVAVGGTATGEIDAAHDVDWFRVTLDSAKTYKFTMRGAHSSGGTLADPLVAIRSSNFNAFNLEPDPIDDIAADNPDSEFTWSPDVSGEYFVEANTTTDGTGTYTIEVAEVMDMMQQGPNREPTGMPGISGNVQTGQTITATTSGISDPDGMMDAVFTYQWIRVDSNTADETIIENANSQTYTVTTQDEGNGLKVRVTFTDDRGNVETVDSALHAVLAPIVIPDDEEGAQGQSDEEQGSQGGKDSNEEQDGNWRQSDDQQRDSQQQEGLTATTHDLPENHDGSAFTFELRFAETPADGFSHETVRDHAFTVTGGSVTKARRLEAGKNLSWEVTVTPSGNGDVSLSAPATTDCTADGAICTAGGDKFSGLAAFTVGGPPPSAPTGLTATVNADNTITLTWDDPGDSTITGYQILRRRPGEGETTLTVYVADTGSDATTYKDTAVTAGTRHVYRIKAINSAGVGPRSAYVNVDP